MTVDWTPRPDQASLRWVVAKWVVFGGFVLGVGALFVTPDAASRLFWNALIPLLPAVFLVNVEVWRNVCPLATLNAVAGERTVARPLSKQAVRVASLIGIVTLFIAIPARKLVLNDDGIATGLVLAVFGLMALASGLRLQRKAGFCNSICPILPVERLYGTRPLAVVENARCTPCRACTLSGCIDLGTERSVLQLLRPAEESGEWLRSLFAIFALSFPGVVVGFYTVPPESAGSVLSVCATLVAAAAISWLVLAVVFTVMKTTPSQALLWSSALAATLYYWFTPTVVASAFVMPAWSEAVMRMTALALVGVWFVHARSTGSVARVHLTRASTRKA